MSPILQEFYNEYARWLNNGAPNLHPFNRGLGLCNNLNRFVSRHANDYSQNLRIQAELQAQFRKENMCDSYPFGMKKYDRERWENTLHLCPKRRAWVYDHAEVAERRQRSALDKRVINV